MSRWNAEDWLPDLQKRLPALEPEHTRHDAAVLLPIMASKEPYLLLTQRSAHLNSHAGEVAFPGGKRDEGDLNLQATALRETEEELGIAAHDIHLISELDTSVSRVGLRVKPLIGVVNPAALIRPNPDEIASVFQVPMEFFLTEKPTHPHKIQYKGQEIIMPSYLFDGYVIWGLTAFMIVEFVQKAYGHSVEWSWPNR